MLRRTAYFWGYPVVATRSRCDAFAKGSCRLVDDALQRSPPVQPQPTQDLLARDKEQDSAIQAGRLAHDLCGRDALRQVDARRPSVVQLTTPRSVGLSTRSGRFFAKDRPCPSANLSRRKAYRPVATFVSMPWPPRSAERRVPIAGAIRFVVNPWWRLAPSEHLNQHDSRSFQGSGQTRSRRVISTTPETRRPILPSLQSPRERRRRSRIHSANRFSRDVSRPSKFRVVGKHVCDPQSHRIDRSRTEDAPKHRQISFYAV